VSTIANSVALVLVFAFALAVGSASASDQEESLTTYPDLRADKELFKSFLAHPYPVRSVSFDHVWERQGGRIVARAVGSLQEHTFFRRYLGGESGEPPILESGISGMTEEGALWWLDALALQGVGGRVQISYPGATTNTRAQSRGAEGLLELRNACWFGLRMMVPGTLAWDGDQFKVNWYDSQWPLVTNTAEVMGQVVGYTNNLPTAIRLHSASWPTAYHYVVVHFEYDPGLKTQFYPTKLVTELVLESGSVRAQWFENVKIEFGEASPPGGFTPNQFLSSTNAAAPMVVIASNQDVYWRDVDGLKKVETVQASPPRRRGARLVVVSFLVASTLALLIVIVRAISRRPFGGHKHKYH